MSQTFLEFKDYARSLVTVDGARYGVSIGNAKYFDRQVTLALLDLQSFIPQLREGHRSVFKEFDLIQEGEASVGILPEGVITDAYYVKTATCPCTSRPFVPYPFEHRMDLFCGKPRITGWQYFFSVDPFASKFIVYPKVTETSSLWLYWNGVKGDFDDADVVRFGNEEAEAVGFFVKARICREVDKDLVLAQSYWTSYAGGPGVLGIRSRLFTDWKRRASAPPSSTSPQPEKLGHCDCTTLQCCWERADCGFSGGFYYIKDAENLWHKITIEGDVGEEVFVIGAGIAEPTWDSCVTAEADGYGFFGGYFHLWNSTSEEFMSITISGSGAEAVIELGPRKADLASISTTARGYRFDPCLKVLNLTTEEFCPLNLLDV